MKTTVVQSTDLGEDWTPSAHMPRALTAARNVQEGDLIRVRQHRTATDGVGRKWHTVRVQDTQIDRSQMMIDVDKWPIAYVCDVDELVELVEISRTAVFRCVGCRRSDDPNTTRLPVLLKDFMDPELMKAGGLQVVILSTTSPDEITGYCQNHGREFLA